MKFCSQEISINSLDSHSAALQVACILLEQGELKNFSQKPHLEITVIGTHETVVYNVWKESHTGRSTPRPHIETKRTTVNSTWFDYNTGHADTEFNIEHEDTDIEKHFLKFFISVH